MGFALDFCSGLLSTSQSQLICTGLTIDQSKDQQTSFKMPLHKLSIVFSKKLPNPVFARLLKEVAKRDDIIREHLNNYKVSENKCQRIKTYNDVKSLTGVCGYVYLRSPNPTSCFTDFNQLLLYCLVTRQEKWGHHYRIPPPGPWQTSQHRSQSGKHIEQWTSGGDPFWNVSGVHLISFKTNTGILHLVFCR